jgi:hypothetical protein
VKVSPIVLLLAGALVGVAAWGSCGWSGKSDATKRLEAALAEQDRAAHVWSATRDSLAQANDALRADSATLEARRRATRSMASDSIGKLLAMIGDSTAQQVVESAVKVVYLEVEACQNQLANCEQRARNAEHRAAGDSSQLAATQQLLDTVRVRWQIAERKAAPSFFRDLWRSRQVTLPLAALSAFLLLSRH